MYRIVYSAFGILIYLQASLSMGHTLFHANIKDLRTSDLNLGGEQMLALQGLIAKQGMVPDILNIQEIQYDLPSTQQPSSFLYGKNLGAFLASSWPAHAPQLQATSLFIRANTGEHAKKDEAGHYCLKKEPSKEEALQLADHQNFGLFPGQYSSFVASRFKQATEVAAIALKDLKWKEFNPEVSLSQFAVGSGEPVNPDIQLFDKVFYSLPVIIDDQLTYIVSLHTVPYFHFGNPKTPNYARNFDQLRFLSWYLHGDALGLQVDTDHLWEHYKVRPLPADAKYIVIGDLNVDIKDRPSTDEQLAFNSAKILSSIISKGQIPFDLSQHTFDSGWLKKFFDYVIFSKHFELSNPVIWNQEKFANAGEVSDHFALSVNFKLPKKLHVSKEL